MDPPLVEYRIGIWMSRPRAHHIGPNSGLLQIYHQQFAEENEFHEIRGMIVFSIVSGSSYSGVSDT